MNFRECYEKNGILLMEGAVGERLKREYSIYPDNWVALAGHIYQEKARKAMKTIYGQYMDIGLRYGCPLLLTTPTRRANRYQVGLSPYNEDIIKDNLELLKELRTESITGKAASEIELKPAGLAGAAIEENRSVDHIFIGGLMGCQGDAYTGRGSLDTSEAYEFHSWQAELFGKAQADFLYAGIMPSLPEAVGMARAMEDTGLPYIISFMIRDTGRLMDGTTITKAIETIDGVVSKKPLSYMTNCVHPVILGKALAHSFNQTQAVKERFAGIQANASPMSPEELESGGEILVSDSRELAEDMLNLHREYNLKILGGCCGTDHIYMEEIAKLVSDKKNRAFTSS